MIESTSRTIGLWAALIALIDTDNAEDLRALAVPAARWTESMARNERSAIARYAFSSSAPASAQVTLAIPRARSRYAAHARVRVSSGSESASRVWLVPRKAMQWRCVAST